MLADFVSLSMENGLQPEHGLLERPWEIGDALGFAETLWPDPWSGHECVLAKLMAVVRVGLADQFERPMNEELRIYECNPIAKITK